ncbi:MAG: DUF5916 domain-containing protein [Bacteroidales bacterium]|nr:DUF5916 domain-containing protein [Bacteroidales bacterium]
MMQRYFLLAILSMILLEITIITSAQDSFQKVKKISTDSLTSEGKRIYFTQRFNAAAPKIDGMLDDECWKEGSWSGNYLQHLPNEGAQPSQPSQLKILYDDKNVYVAIRCFDYEPDKIDKQLGRRDDFAGDIVGVAFDSYHDRRTAFEFDLTAGGSKLDLLLENDGWDVSWNAVWEGKVAYEDSAWTAEMKIPLSQLRYGDQEEQIWGLHSWRWINRYQEESNWNLIPRDNPGLIRSIGELHGINKLPKSRRIELLPYALAKMTTYEKEEGNPFATGFDKSFAAGLNGKIGLSSDFTLDFAINPDFGQVEADPAQLNLSAFEIFYEEKRPFFLEGKNITDFSFGNDQLFYSRRIGHSPSYSPNLNANEFAERIDNTSILGAVKVTGKTKKGLSISIIEGLTAKETAETETLNGKDKITVEPLTNYFVGRIQKDIKNGNTIIGGMFTTTNRFIEDDYLEFLNKTASTGGIDFRHHWKNKSYYVDAKLIFSHIKGSEEAITNLQNAPAHYYQQPDAHYLGTDSTLTSLSGFGGQFEIGKRSNGRWRYNTSLSWRSPGLDLNDIGFMQRADKISQDNNLSYVVNEPSGIIREYSVNFNQNNQFNFVGDYLGSSGMISANVKFKNKWNYYAHIIRQGKSLDTRILRGGPSIFIKGLYCSSFSVNSDDSKRLIYGLHYHTHIFDDKTSVNHDFSPNIVYKITNSLQLSTQLNYSLATNSMQYIDDDYENDYFLARLDQKTLGLTLRLDYAITPELTIQYYGNPYISVGEYSDFKLITDARAESYGNLYHTFTNNELVHDPIENQYNLSYNGNSYLVNNPDFNFQQLRSNFVIRWEYKTGSTLYFVWTHNRNQYQNITNTSINDNIDELRGIYPENLFLIKFNYWFTL